MPPTPADLTGRGRLRRWSRLLWVEAAAQRAELGRQPGLPLGVGLRISEGPAGMVYRFETLSDSNVPEGTTAKLRIEASEYPAEVLHRGDNEITLFVEQAEDGVPPVKAQVATLVSDPVFLTEELGKRMSEFAEKPAISAPLERLLGLCSGARLEPHRESHVVPPEIDLNDEQHALIAAALVEPVWFGWGPPGTGKTTALGAYVAEAAIRNERLLVTAHSNVAVDAALVATVNELQARGKSRLVERGATLRLGVAQLRAAQALRLSARELVLAARPDLDRARREMEDRIRRGRLSADDVANLRRQLGDLRSEIRRLESELIGTARILFCTLPKIALDPRIHDSLQVDAVVVDEASMALPPQVALAAALAKHRLTIFGDFRQLAPIVISSDDGVLTELGRDIFAHTGVSKSVDMGTVPTGVSMLEVQHRMHPEIRRVISDLSYLGRLRDGTGVAARTTPFGGADPKSGHPVVVVNTRLEASRGWRDRGHGSRLNPVSALWSTRLVVEALRTCTTVALLTPYRAQVHLLTALVRDLGLRERVTVGTIHRMQGSEAPAVVVDLVDAKPLGIPGRLFHEPAGQRLVNVALSRAQGKLVVLGDPQLMQPTERFRRTGAALAKLYQETLWQPPREPWSTRSSDCDLRFMSDIEAAPPTYATDVRGRPAVAWIGARMPAWLQPRELVGLHLTPDPPQPDQAIVVVGDVVWIVAERPHGGNLAWRVESARFSAALFDQLHGGRRPMAPCPEHSDAMAVETRGQAVVVACPHRNCRTTRSATAADIDLWAVYLDLRCPGHNAVLSCARSAYGWFYHCTRDGCRHTQPV